MIWNEDERNFEWVKLLPHTGTRKTASDVPIPFHFHILRSKPDVLIFNELCQGREALWLILKIVKPLTFTDSPVSHLSLSFSFYLSHLSSHLSILPLTSSVSPPCIFSLLCLIAFLFALRDAWVAQSSPLSSLPKIHLHPVLARSVSWAALEEISDDLAFPAKEKKGGILGSRRRGFSSLFSPHIHLSSAPPAHTSCSQVQGKVTIIYSMCWQQFRQCNIHIDTHHINSLPWFL